jgi:hypothetical protein
VARVGAGNGSTNILIDVKRIFHTVRTGVLTGAATHRIAKS